MTDLVCPKCGNQYKSNELNLLRCKKCKTWLQWAEVQSDNSVSEFLSSEGIAQVEMSQLDDATRALVAASDRTTAAVRSLAVYFFTLLTFSLFAGVLVGLGYGSGSPGLVVAGYLAAFVGFLVALIRGLSELQKSRR
jgi:predicted ATP-dependent serine protease